MVGEVPPIVTEVPVCDCGVVGMPDESWPSTQMSTVEAVLSFGTVIVSVNVRLAPDEMSDRLTCR